MKKRILIAINSVLAAFLAVLGFISCRCSGFGRGPECMYGGPDMYGVETTRTEITEEGDTLEITGKDTIVKQKVIVDVKDPDHMRVMYGTPYSRFSEKERIIVPEETE